MELTAEKRAPIVDKLTQQIEHLLTFPYSTTERARRIAYKLTYAIESVIAATSEPATIKAGDEVFPGGVALPADAIDALSFQTFQPKRISDLMQQTRDHRAWVEADKAIAIDESRMSELTALREKLADEKKLHDQTRGWLRDEKAKVATVACERDKWKASSHEYHEAAHEATAELHKTRAKLTVAESSLAELRAAVDAQSKNVTNAGNRICDLWVYPGAKTSEPTFSAACLAAYHAENAEVPNG